MQQLKELAPEAYRPQGDTLEKAPSMENLLNSTQCTIPESVFDSPVMRKSEIDSSLATPDVMSTPKQEVSAASALPDETNIGKLVVSQLAPKQKASGLNIVQALETVPDFKIDPQTLQVPGVPDSHVVDVIKFLRSSHLPGTQAPKGTKELLQALAKTTIAPSVAAVNAEIRNYFSQLKQQQGVDITPTRLGKMAQMWEDVKTLGKGTLRSGLKRKTP